MCVHMCHKEKESRNHTAANEHILCFLVVFFVCVKMRNWEESNKCGRDVSVLEMRIIIVMHEYLHREYQIIHVECVSLKCERIPVISSLSH